MFLGIDLSNPDARAVLVDGDGRVIARAVEPRNDVAAAVAAAHKVASGGRAETAGLAAGNAPGETSETARNIGTALQVPLVHVVTPGTAMAVAEHWCGAARGVRSAVALTAGANVYAGIIIDGRPLTGAHGVAGAAAWLALNPVEREDYRRLGCLDAEVAEAGIVRRLVWRIKSGDRSRALDMAGGALTAITAGHVFDAARGGDGVAISVVRDTAKYIGMAIANLVAIIDPDIVVVGGFIASAHDLLLDASRTELSRRLNAPGNSLPVVPALLGDDATAIGAARAAMLAGRAQGPAPTPAA